jgi:hypothetical protein
MIDLESDKFGYYQVGERRFYNKRTALLHSSQTGEKIQYCYYDGIFGAFDRTKLGKTDLYELYRQRAQQLRDEYDHLILYYSGGADSHNILMTFLNNKIKLDQVFVMCPKNVLGTSIYTPNTADTTCENRISEWHFTIEPTLKWLAYTHPEIQIEIKDYTDIVTDKFFNDDVFLVHAYGVGSLARAACKSDIGQALADKGKKVASIFGVEKPHIGKNDKNQVGMAFKDRGFYVVRNYVGEPEFFYWSPKLPELTFEMAYQLYLAFKRNKEYHPMMNIPHKFSYDVYEFNNKLTTDVCYAKTWNYSRFQTLKSISPAAVDKDIILYKTPEFSRALQAWKYYQQDLTSGISNRFIITSKEYDLKNTLQTTEVEQIISFNTRSYYLGDL